VKPLFVLAPPRSFTSVTCAMIGVHPEMFGLPETNLFARETYGKLAPLYKTRPPFRHGLLRAFAELTFGEQSDENVNVVKVWLERQNMTPTKDLFEDLGALAEPRELVEKSPLHVYKMENLERIERAFPDARYLHLTRHPRGTCESIYALRQETLERVNKMKEKLGAAPGPVEGPLTSQLQMTPERLWFDPHMNILEFLQQVPTGRRLRLRGEDLLADPDRYLVEIAEWLGISHSPEAIAAMKHPETSPFACLGPPTARFGNDPSFLEAPALRPYRPKVEDMEAPLSWDPTLKFTDVVTDLAGLLGY
jgi:hypothetical protein